MKAFKNGARVLSRRKREEWRVLPEVFTLLTRAYGYWRDLDTTLGNPETTNRYS
jgi:hypothetical protein